MADKYEEKLYAFIAKYADLINSRNYTQLYENAVDEYTYDWRYCDYNVISKLTEMLLDIGENPLEHLNTIPPLYLSKSSIKFINIPSNIISIRSNAFKGCESLEEVVFNEGLLVIDDKAFMQCMRLYRIHFPKSLKRLERDCFFMTNAKDITYGGTTLECKMLTNMFRRSNLLYEGLVIQCSDGRLECIRENIYGEFVFDSIYV